ncbi:MAG TPA: FtsX-like permease family protein [Paludibacter sp.]|nr:MAG: Lipoprotein-releasing system transmembrane protein LolE [Bacteroidetes bacterium ADurb.Bin174]HQB28373.1 FtsX-like permease family protein [Paludibacter sp.]
MGKYKNIRIGFSKLKFSLRIAGRYLFSKKSHNAINVISGISSAGVAIGTIALVVVLSIFNGFELLFSDLFSAFDPDLQIALKQGKQFSIDTPEFEAVKKLEGIAVFTEVVEENALLRYKEKQMPVLVKGVSDDFKQMTRIDSIMFDGEFLLYDGAFERSVVGAGIAATLGLSAYAIDPLYIYAPKRTSKINLLRPDQSFNQSGTFISGIFSVQQNEYDNQYVLVSLNLARALFEYQANDVSAVELKLLPFADTQKVKNELQKLLGDEFSVKDRYEQQEAYFKIMQIEKWITYLILSFILLIASFNIIGSLSMLIIDKKEDIITLRNLGADQKLIRQIFLLEGWMISAVGAVLGIIIGTILSFLQEKIGFIKLGPGFIVENYPVVIQFSDILLVFFTVLALGFFAAWYPVRYIRSNINKTV